MPASPSRPLYLSTTKSAATNGEVPGSIPGRGTDARWSSRHGRRALNPETEVRTLDEQHIGRAGREVRHRIANPWSGHCPARVRFARPPQHDDEVEHGGLCSALIRRRTRFDSWHLDLEDWPSTVRQPSRKRWSARERRAGSTPASSAGRKLNRTSSWLLTSRFGVRVQAGEHRGTRRSAGDPCKITEDGSTPSFSTVTEAEEDEAPGCDPGLAGASPVGHPNARGTAASRGSYPWTAWFDTRVRDDCSAPLWSHHNYRTAVQMGRRRSVTTVNGPGCGFESRRAVRCVAQSAEQEIPAVNTTPI